MTAKANIGLIGVGLWGRHIARNLAVLGGLGALDDHNAACTQKYATEYGVKPMAFADMLADASIEAIALATPPASHHRLALDALKAGKHIYVEKPLALTLDEAAAIAAHRQNCKTARHGRAFAPLSRWVFGVRCGGESGKNR